MKSLRHALVLALAMFCATSIRVTPAVTAAAPRTAERSAANTADTPTMSLVGQDLALAPDATLNLRFHPAQPLGADTVSVIAYQRISQRDDLMRAIAGRLSGFVDRVDIDPQTVTTDADGNVTIAVPTESTTVTPTALRLADPGLYPLSVRIYDPNGKVVTEMVTFVDRLPAAGGEPEGVVSVAVLASVTAPPSLPGAGTPLPADVQAQITALTQYSPDVALSLAISPQILGRLDNATLALLRTALSNSALLSQPLVPFDPSAAVQSGLRDRFTQLLVDGENAVGAVDGLPLPGRSVWYAPAGISVDGATMLRDLGARTLVIPAGTYLAAGGNLGDLTDYSQLFETQLSTSTDAAQVCGTAGEGCMPTAVIDPVMSQRLADPSLSIEQAALYTAADVVVYRDQFADSLSSSNRHALVLGPNGQGVPDAQRTSRMVAMLGATNAVRFITLDQLQQSSSDLIADGRPVTLQLPQPPPNDLKARNQTLQQAELAAATVSSMLVDDNGRADTWKSTIDTLYSTALTDGQVATAVGSVNDQLAAIRACIVAPSSYTFTLTGQSTNLPLRITNACNERLRIVVHLEAAAGKMQFPAVDPERELPPDTTSDVKIPVTARTNGTFNVTLDILTPAGQLPITKQVTLRARINALTGLPQLITGAGLLLLLTWWVRNQRRSRRARRAAEVAGSDHPAVQAAAAGPVNAPSS